MGFMDEIKRWARANEDEEDDENFENIASARRAKPESSDDGIAVTEFQVRTPT